MKKIINVLTPGRHAGMMMVMVLVLMPGTGPFSLKKSSPAALPAGSCSAFVDISGKSNVNRFELSMQFPDGQAFRVNTPAKVGPGSDRLYRISIPVKKFETGNRLIYNDFIELIKADEYPDIVIEIPYEHLRNIFSGIPCTKHQIGITIAGVKKRYTIPSYSGHCSGDRYYVSGFQKLNLADFDLSPPTRLDGLIRVDKQVSIQFNFLFSTGNMTKP